jgi:hypothetical protein
MLTHLENAVDCVGLKTGPKDVVHHNFPSSREAFRVMTITLSSITLRSSYGRLHYEFCYRDYTPLSIKSMT